MADYDKGYPLVVLDEGKTLSNDPSDSGGLTYAGIASASFPDWEGFAIIRERGLKAGESLPELEPMVKAFYKTNFWDAVRGDEIINQEEANTIFDRAVNVGIKPSVRMSQEVAGVPQTGEMDTSTLNSINASNPYA